MFTATCPAGVVIYQHLALLALLSPSLSLLASSMTVIDLQSQHHPSTPIDTLKSMQTACQELGINEFDVYGDYTKGNDTSKDDKLLFIDHHQCAL